MKKIVAHENFQSLEKQKTKTSNDWKLRMIAAGGDAKKRWCGVAVPAILWADVFGE